MVHSPISLLEAITWRLEQPWFDLITAAVALEDVPIHGIKFLMQPGPGRRSLRRLMQQVAWEALSH